MERGSRISVWSPRTQKHIGIGPGAGIAVATKSAVSSWRSFARWDAWLRPGRDASSHCPAARQWSTWCRRRISCMVCRISAKVPDVLTIRPTRPAPAYSVCLLFTTDSQHHPVQVAGGGFGLPPRPCVTPIFPYNENVRAASLVYRVPGGELDGTYAASDSTSGTCSGSSVRFRGRLPRQLRVCGIHSIPLAADRGSFPRAGGGARRVSVGW